MRALIVRDPWVEMEADGTKTWELRSRNTYVRGRIGLIRSGSGLIIASVELVDAFPVSEALLRKHVRKHRVPMEQVHQYGKRLYAWVLANPIRLKQPQRYTHPQGAVIWVTVPSIC